jgi:hypothetical protein
MKAVLFALCFLVGADYTMNQGMATRRFMAGVVAFGQEIGSWVYYPAA